MSSNGESGCCGSALARTAMTILAIYGSHGRSFLLLFLFRVSPFPVLAHRHKSLHESTQQGYAPYKKRITWLPGWRRLALDFRTLTIKRPEKALNLREIAKSFANAVNSRKRAQPANERVRTIIGSGLSPTLVTKPRLPPDAAGPALVGRASINPALPGGGGTRTLANNKASGVIFQDGELRCSVDGTARYYLASWGRTHLTPSRGRASAQKGRPQRDRE